MRRCRKCNRADGPIDRHHKGYDSLTGRYNKSIGFRYHEFLDCVELCVECHCEIHLVYQPYVDKWINRSPKGAAKFRKKLIEVCDQWLAGKIKSPTIPPLHLAQWKAQRELFLKERNARGTEGGRELDQRIS